MFETEIFGPCLIRKLKWGGRHAPLVPPVATPLFLLRYRTLLQKLEIQSKWNLTKKSLKVFYKVIVDINGIPIKRHQIFQAICISKTEMPRVLDQYFLDQIISFLKLIKSEI